MGDIGDPGDAEAMIGVALERFGQLDVLVNDAAAPAGLDREVIDEIPIEVFDDVIRINLRGAWLMCRAAVPAMRRGRWGRIINVSSMAGVIAAPRSTPYSASKAGMIGLTRALSMDVAAWGITVNAIAPGALATSRSVLSEDPISMSPPNSRRAGAACRSDASGYRRTSPRRCATSPSDDASYMTGQVLVLDGGGPAPFPLPRPEEAV